MPMEIDENEEIEVMQRRCVAAEAKQNTNHMGKTFAKLVLRSLMSDTEPCICHRPSHGGATNRGGQIERENLGLSGSGRPQAAGKPLKKVGGEAPHLFEGFPGRPGPPRARKSMIFPLNLAPLVSATPM